MRPVIVVYAKAPEPGRVKTRLYPAVPPDDAVVLHTAFVADMLDILQSFVRRADIELHTDSETDAWREHSVPRRIQHEGGLALRLLQTITSGLSQGREQVIILGSDSPTLPAASVEALLDSNADVTLGPVSDGGFYAIACRRSHPRMFESVTWSGPRTLEQTLRAAHTAGLSTALAPPWYDVDTPDDLARLCNDPHLRAHTRSALERISALPLRSQQPGNQSKTGDSW